MSIERKSVRERLQDDLADFKAIDGAVFTTFTFVPDFFEQNVLPILFQVEGSGRTRRRVEVNTHLETAPVSVFYDMSAQPRGGGEFRYQHLPIRLDKGGIFHPKVALIAGRDAEDKRAVLVSVSSANLTLRGWGHNEEAVGSFWVETEPQREELLDFIAFLSRSAKRAAVSQKGKGAVTEVEAITAVRTALRELDGLSKATADLAAFRCFGLRRKDEDPPAAAITPGRNYWSRLTVFSPYWSSRDDTRSMMSQFRARRHELVPAPKASGERVCLGFEDEKTITEHCIADAAHNRFRHAKLYVARGKRRARVTVGSANFTVAALGTATKKPINVEAVVSYEIRPSHVHRVIPALLPLDDLVEVLDDGINEEEDSRLPFTVFVAFDWSSREYRVSISQVGRARDFRVVLPGAGEHRIEHDKPTRITSPSGPSTSREFTVSYLPHDGAEERRIVVGLVTEFGLDDSDHKFTPKLKLDEFFASWFRRNASATFDFGPAPEPEDEEAEGGALLGMTHVAADQLDATNLFDIYRAIARLEDEHLKPAAEAKDWGTVREFLVARPDSVVRFADLLEKQQTQLGVRFALLLECSRLFKTYSRKRLDERSKAGRSRIAKAQAKAKREVAAELRKMDRVGKTAADTLDWFEQQLQDAWA